MAYKARPILKVRFLNVLLSDGMRHAVVKSTLTYKGKPVTKAQMKEWWGGIPKVCLSASNPIGCPTSIADLGSHNGHLGAFKSETEASVYIERVKVQLTELCAALGLDKTGDKVYNKKEVDSHTTAFEKIVINSFKKGFSYDDYKGKPLQTESVHDAPEEGGGGTCPF